MILKQKKRRKLSSQRLKVLVLEAFAQESFWSALLVFLGALALLSAVPFYPLYLVIFLSLLCGAVAYFKSPPFGTLLSTILAIPCFAYQSPILGWMTIIPMFFVLISFLATWRIISLLEILIFMPFSPFPFNLLSLAFPFGLFAGAFLYGSKRILALAIPAILIILFLTAVWHTPNACGLPVKEKIYGKETALMLTKPAAGLTSIGGEGIKAFLRMFGIGQGAQTSSASKAVDYCVKTLITLLFSDSGIPQLILWCFVLFLATHLSTIVSSRFSQTISSFPLFLVPIAYFFISLFYHVPFHLNLVFSTLVSWFAFVFLDIFNLNILHEKELRRKDKLSAFSSLGVEDLSLVAKEKGLDDVGNYEEVKKELYNAMILPFEDPVVAEQYHIKPAKGILLFGPPGCGKTMLMRALAKEMKFTFLYIKTSNILSKWVGESEKNISLLFQKARSMKPCILFFDEIDALGRKRTEFSEDDTGPKVLSTLLQEMDGINAKQDGVIVVGATNAPHMIDPALMRPGRLDKIIYMPLPDLHGRKEIFKVLLRKYPVDENIDYDLLAAKTPRFSGADIKNVIEETARLVAERAKKKDELIPITTNDLLDVIKRTKPSVRLADIELYEKFKLDYERKRRVEERKKEKEVRWEDVVGLDDVKKALLDAIQLPLLHEDLLKKYKIKPSKGILLFGPPGCGKTLIAKAAANELNATFIYVSPTDLTSRYESGAEKLKEIFNRAKENAPAIIFIDEIETLIPSRKFALSDVVGEFLTQLDGVKGMKGVLVLGATNEPQYLDPAALRPGRFDKIFYVPPPNEEGRAKLFEKYLGEFAKGVDLQLLARESEGFSGADIASVCEKVKLEMVKKMVNGEKAQPDTNFILSIVKSRKPSITKQLIEQYKRFMEEYGERR